MKLTRPVISMSPLCAALALAGCGTIDNEKLETKLKSGIESQAGVKLKSVDCPEGRKLKQGDVFNCTALSTAGEKANVKVTQTDDEGNVRYVVEG